MSAHNAQQLSRNPQNAQPCFCGLLHGITCPDLLVESLALHSHNVKNNTQVMPSGCGLMSINQLKLVYEGDVILLQDSHVHSFHFDDQYYTYHRYALPVIVFLCLNKT